MKGGGWEADFGRFVLTRCIFVSHQAFRADDTASGCVRNATACKRQLRPSSPFPAHPPAFGGGLLIGFASPLKGQLAGSGQPTLAAGWIAAISEERVRFKR